MIDHDRLFKELLSTFFVEFIELSAICVCFWWVTSYEEFTLEQINSDLGLAIEENVSLFADAEEVPFNSP